MRPAAGARTRLAAGARVRLAAGARLKRLNTIIRRRRNAPLRCVPTAYADNDFISFATRAYSDRTGSEYALKVLAWSHFPANLNAGPGRVGNAAARAEPPLFAVFESFAVAFSRRIMSTLCADFMTGVRTAPILLLATSVAARHWLGIGALSTEFELDGRFCGRRDAAEDSRPQWAGAAALA
jgi:hypothetical protein